jgi:hypothetical protein
VWIAEEANYLGHSGLEDATVFGVGDTVHWKRVAVAEEGVEDAVAVVMV